MINNLIQLNPRLTPTVFSKRELNLLAVIAEGVQNATVWQHDGKFYLRLKTDCCDSPSFIPVDPVRIWKLDFYNHRGWITPKMAKEYLSGLKMGTKEMELSGNILRGAQCARDEEYYYIDGEKLSIEKFRFFYGGDAECPLLPPLTYDELTFLAYSYKLGINCKVLKNADGSVVLKLNEIPTVVVSGVPFSQTAVDKVAVDGMITHERAGEYLRKLALTEDEMMLTYLAMRYHTGHTCDENYYYVGGDKTPISIEKIRYHFGNVLIRNITMAQIEKLFVVERNHKNRVTGFKLRKTN